MSQIARVLVVDDEANARTALASLLRDEGYSVETAADGFKALPKLDEFSPDVIVTDLKMPGLDGLGLMRRALDQDPDRSVVMMTAVSSIDTAVAAMQAGAADYLTKPVNFDELQLVIQREVERRRLKQEAGLMRKRLTERHRLPNLIGSSPVMQVVFDTVLQVAQSRVTVLITGESGTGKELIAAALHEQSARSKGPFVKLHCAALSEQLLESELFGHERGAFTGAVDRRDGRFQQADGGTLFLDEIGEISPAVQVKLLRFLQEHEFERVGGNQTIKVDVRIIAATNRNLRERVKQGLFREDLFYRLNVVSIEMPPLRQRASDIGPLAQHFLVRYAKENSKTIRGFAEGALEKLMRYSWPGNVRELENTIERAVVICRGEMIRPEDLAVNIDEKRSDIRAEQEGPPIPGSRLAAIERFAIMRTMERVGGSTSRAAELLGISPRKIQYKMQEYLTPNPDAEDDAGDLND